jgi:hypothetical protein
MNQDTIQWIVNIILGVMLAYLSFRKAPAERLSLNGSAAKSYAEAAQIQRAENQKLEEVIANLEHRMLMVEQKKYRITMEFEIGDPPTMGVVTIEPVIPTDITRPLKSRQKAKMK